MKTDKKSFPALIFWTAEALALLAAYFCEFRMVGYFAFACILLAVAVIMPLYRIIGAYAGKNPRRAKKFKVGLTSLIGIALAGLIGIEIPIIVSARTDNNPEAPYLVVLGAQVVGTQPSQSLWDRLLTARDYLDAYPDAKAVVSGGQGEGENISEAECMKEWLVSNGISENRILMEAKSTSTYENIKNSLSVIKEDGGDSSGRIAIATSEYHVYRAKLNAKKLGAQPLGVAARSYERLQMCAFFVREAFGVAVALLT